MNECYRKTHIKTLLPPPTNREARQERGRHEWVLQENAHKDITAPQPTERQDKREVDMNECYRKTHIKTWLPPPTNQEASQERGRHEWVLQENAHKDIIAPPTNQEASQDRGRHEWVLQENAHKDIIAPSNQPRGKTRERSTWMSATGKRT